MNSLTPILARTPVTTIEDVLAVMQQIDQALPPIDGVACFNKLYLQVTRDVLTAEQKGGFQSIPFLSALDVAFGNLYFAALRADASGGGSAVPPAWQPLFEARSSTEIAPIQFALAGMNAHINRDLPVGLVETFGALGLDMSNAAPQHDDFERVNDVLAGTETEMRANYFSGLLATLGKTFSSTEDVIANWSVRKARDVAWSNGEILWKLRHNLAFLEADYIATLDRGCAFASHLLLQSTVD